MDELKQTSKDDIRDLLELRQEVVKLSDGQFLHKSHIIVIMTVDDVPITTHLTLNVNFNKESSRIVTKEIIYEGRKLYSRSRWSIWNKLLD